MNDDHQFHLDIGLNPNSKTESTVYLSGPQLEKIKRRIIKCKVGEIFEVHQQYHRIMLMRYAESLRRQVVSVVNNEYNFNRYSDMYIHYCCGNLVPVHCTMWQSDDVWDISTLNYHYICDRCNGQGRMEYQGDKTSSFGYDRIKGENCLIIIG
jgi:hypothetical protein